MAHDSVGVMEEVLGSLLVGLEYFGIVSLSYAEHVVLCEDVELDGVGSAVIHLRCADAFVPVDRLVTNQCLPPFLRKEYIGVRLTEEI